MSGSFLALHLYAGFWLLQPVMKRPIVTRSNQALHLVELVAWLALSAGFFFLLLWAGALQAIGLALCFVMIDILIRRVFLEVEIRRVIAKSKRISRRRALSRIRSRVTGM